MKRLSLFFLPLLLLVFPYEPPAFADLETTYFVIVNEKNTTDLNIDEKSILLRRLYLKEQTWWPKGGKSLFFARNENSMEEQVFRKIILLISDRQLDDHWIRMKQTRGVTPPRSVNSTRILLRQIKSRPDAVGVISKSDYLKFVKDDPQIRIFTTISVMAND